MRGKVIAVTLNPSIDKTITIEHLVPYGLNRVVSTRTDPGGKGINVAKVLKNFGADVTVTGLIAGSQGKLLLDYLKNADIPADFLKNPGETRTNLKIFDQSVNKTTEINETGFHVTPDVLDSFRQKFKKAVKEADIVVLSGSLPPGVPEDFYAECIHTAKNQSVKCVLDADAGALAQGVKAVPFAVKPNLHELELLSGQTFSSRNEVAKAAGKLIETGIQIVIVSMGPDGAIIADRNKTYKANSWKIEEKSATGAGDSMVASLAYSILNKESLYDIAKITTAAGTVTASKEGTQTCTLDEVLHSLANVTVTRL
ncbi:MAG TPA: 1-phosphofructokinase [Caproiciproducens sp.]|nr:1-phosphofructokinase [Caproiciproducens sp.]